MDTPSRIITRIQIYKRRLFSQFFHFDRFRFKAIRFSWTRVKTVYYKFIGFSPLRTSQVYSACIFDRCAMFRFILHNK